MGARFEPRSLARQAAPAAPAHGPRAERGSGGTRGPVPRSEDWPLHGRQSRRTASAGRRSRQARSAVAAAPLCRRCRTLATSAPGRCTALRAGARRRAACCHRRARGPLRRRGPCAPPGGRLRSGGGRGPMPTSKARERGAWSHGSGPRRQGRPCLPARPSSATHRRTQPDASSRPGKRRTPNQRRAPDEAATTFSGAASSHDEATGQRTKGF